MVVASRAVNEFWGPRLNILVDRMSRIAEETKVSLMVWDYSYATNGLMRLVEVESDRGSLSELTQAFPALSGKAKRLFEQAMREERNRVSIIDLPGGKTFAIIVTPENMMLLAVKAKSAIGRLVLEKMAAAVADIRNDFPALLEQPRPKIAEFKPAFYGRHLAALS